MGYIGYYLMLIGVSVSLKSLGDADGGWQRWCYNEGPNIKITENSCSQTFISAKEGDTISRCAVSESEYAFNETMFSHSSINS
jgi:hypothetical protein